ncbi:MAG: protoheme IX farnesyltransferase [Candidatus Marinimicrobia bacterium]|nr:protoheme IX farnesyltransferase [Candidatus Neomarinimicrobiota bacterium]|tara:strand:- start:14615 stop:15442 length:828 start_codon:yes stop_codon:yes gene_type:complete
MVLISTWFGFYAGIVKLNQSISSYEPIFIISLVLGALFSSCGVAALNEYIEADLDKLMDRTKNRPIPSGTISAKAGLIFGVLMSSIGLALFWFLVNKGTAIISALTLVLYLFIYTPLKRKTPLNTLVGAFPGALPPLGGWLAATGKLSKEAWILFAILFAWQIPHFLSIAWIYRKDYKKGGFKMYTGEKKITVFRLYIFIFTFLMIYYSILPTMVGIAGTFYLASAMILGMIFFFSSMGLILKQNGRTAKILLKTTVFYLPLLLILYIIEQNFIL